MNKKQKQKLDTQKPTTQTTVRAITWLGLDRWLQLYKPIRNKNLRGEGLPIECMFETFGSELEQVKATPKNKVWTLVEEGRQQLLYPGFHLVNRQGYFICKVPWDNPDLVVIYETDRFFTIETASPEDIASSDKWKLELGAKCNRLLDLAEHLEESSMVRDQHCATDLRSLIERVAEFEHLQT